MNKVELSGRLVKDPEIRRTSNGDKETMIGRYTLAVERRYKQYGKEDVDFIRCVVFNKGAEFAEKYLCRGEKIIVCGRIQMETYTKENGQRMTNVEVIVDEQEFADSKGKPQRETPENFMDIPTGDMGELPFN